MQITLGNDRFAGRAPPPSRIAVLVTPAQVAREKGIAVVHLDVATRQQAWHQSATLAQVARSQRLEAEVKLRPGEKPTARVVKMTVAKTQAVKPGFIAAKAPELRKPEVHPGAPSHAAAPTTHPDQHTAAPHSPAPTAHTGTTAPPSHPTGPTATHPPGTGTAPPGTHPPGTGTAAPGTHPPGTTATPKPPVPPGHPMPPNEKDKEKDKVKDKDPRQ